MTSPTYIIKRSQVEAVLSMADSVTIIEEAFRLCGDDFVENVLKEYQCPIDSGMRQRIRYCGLSMAIGELYYAQARGYDSYARFCQDCLRREFGSR